jgi:hypothetical protein
VAPLATPADLRRLTGGAWADGLAALDALEAASSAVRTYCGWHISTEVEATAVVDRDGGRVLTVPCLHLTAVHMVLDQDGATLDGYQWSAMGALFRPGRWPAGFRAVTVTYSGGYPVVPRELVAVVCGLAGRYSTPAGVASWTVGSQTLTFSGEAGPGLTSVESAVLDRYRIVPGD